MKVEAKPMASIFLGGSLKLFLMAKRSPLIGYFRVTPESVRVWLLSWKQFSNRRAALETPR